ncbi:hypothetical protein D9757_011102 [Collybiopsis confluens]|uniref:Uncharacterized protein n=1 Tax=Collybiopsis confluens TaxID=2823264 RepID=A0A8H5LXC4_9AGAR|nr:hypothetical protein D9757_011102 [Collybiopsis confluens]
MDTTREESKRDDKGVRTEEGEGVMTTTKSTGTRRMRGIKVPGKWSKRPTSPANQAEPTPSEHKSTSPPARAERPPTQVSSSATWDASEHALRALAAAAQASSMPFVGVLSSVALSILDIIRNTKDNQDSFKQLASAACNLAFTVSTTYQRLHSEGKQDEQSSSPLHSDSESGLRTHDTSLNEEVQNLIATFEAIKEFVDSRLSRPLLRRFVSSQSDSSLIQATKINSRTLRTHSQ